MSARHAKLAGGRWARLRRAVFARDGYRCRACGRPGRLECDHIVPLHLAGAPWELANLQTLCRGCHVAKSRRELVRPDPEREAWREILRGMV